VNRVRFLMLLICLMLFASAPVTLIVIEVVSDQYVHVSVFNTGPASLQAVTVTSGDKEHSLGDLSASQGQAVSVRRVARSQIVIRLKGSDGQAQTLLQLPSDDVNSIAVAVKDGKLQSFSVTPRRKLWWR
jgi:hypothetical protein